jgi:transcriptional regulator with XRE-family HTH domain
MTLGEVLRKERERSRISRGEAALRLGISETAYQGLEEGASPAEKWVPLLARIAIELETPMSRLLADSGRAADTRSGSAGRLIALHRARRNKTVAELARTLALPVDELERIESGDSPIEEFGHIVLRFAEMVAQPVFNLCYPCGVPIAELDDYP